LTASTYKKGGAISARGGGTDGRDVKGNFCPIYGLLPHLREPSSEGEGKLFLVGAILKEKGDWKGTMKLKEENVIVRGGHLMYWERGGGRSTTWTWEKEMSLKVDDLRCVLCVWSF